jgi:hypothetical protein
MDPSQIDRGYKKPADEVGIMFFLKTNEDRRHQERRRRQAAVDPQKQSIPLAARQPVARPAGTNG